MSIGWLLRICLGMLHLQLHEETCCLRMKAAIPCDARYRLEPMRDTLVLLRQQRYAQKRGPNGNTSKLRCILREAMRKGNPCGVHCQRHPCFPPPRCAVASMGPTLARGSLGSRQGDGQTVSLS